MVSTDSLHGDLSDGEDLSGGDGAGAWELGGLIHVIGGDHEGLRILLQQGRDVLRVHMIGMLVCDQHSVEFSGPVPEPGEVPGIDQDPLTCRLDQYACMSEMCDPHGAIFS
ncbi:hypothetical protein GCM10009618_20710 [Nesterenkonia lacusekhoensis]